MKAFAGNNKGMFRVRDWWGKAALLMGMVYLFAAHYNISFNQFFPLALLSLITIAGFASTGYLFNDLFDIKKDAIAGKRNFIANKSAFTIALLFFLSAAVIFTPWYFLPHTGYSFVLIALQLLLFIIYSIPPIRLKERGLSGIITDALYAHGVPVFLAAYTFALAAHAVFLSADIFVLIAWQVVAGVRNILVHQADDIENDTIAGSRNFVASLNPSSINRMLNRIKIIELALCILFFGWLAAHDILFGLCALLLVLLIVAEFTFLKDVGSNPRYFPNNIYEKWLPVAYLCILTVSDTRFLILLLLHVLLFNFAFYVLAVDRAYGLYQTIPFRGYVITTRIYLSYPINNTIYYLLRIGGIDLKKENVSAWGYFKNRLKKKGN